MKSLAAAGLLLARSAWAEKPVVDEVALKEAFSTNTIQKGKVVSSSKLPAGTIAKVVRVESNTVWLVHGSTTNQVPVSVTDYSNRVQAIVAKEAAEREALEKAAKEQTQAEREVAQKNEARKREWFEKNKLLGGEVTQVLSNGFLVKVDCFYPVGKSVPNQVEERTVLLVGSSKTRVQGERIKFYAASLGRHSHVDSDGVAITIEKWAVIKPPDFGVTSP